MGRPSKWTAENRKEIIKNTRMLGLRHLAANLSGVSERLLYEWLAEGSKEDGLADFVQFAQEIEKARAEYIARKWGRIEMAAQADPRYWTADMTQLERMDPDHFGRRERIDLGGHDGKPIELRIKIEWPNAVPETK